MASAKEMIAYRAAQELSNGDVVNLGIGLPTLVSNYIPPDVHIILQSENGILGMGELCMLGEEDKDCVNSGNQFVKVLPGASYFDSATSFGIIRGGHVDITILGALQVDETGTLASHIVPGKMVPGMGGAMDLVEGAKKVIIATTHTAKGAPKLLNKVTLPITAVNKVDMIITELAVIEVTKEGFLLKEIAHDTTAEEVQNLTEAKLLVSSELKTMLPYQE
ncbi:butyryl-CoA:acetoacetate CoA-transferase beta subunit [Lachnotalea glycerini]|uniref:3-oxoacid CoA-transferase subunit B n=1 Tax=Lachnotalea glycerini TaxID=1763509 RepID=A0A255IM37_9FIRM|nr:3-oxoacid CoA-transferase subunit B [Lachnotalea glycerini]OYO41440.1 succinyl-CoA--3-ketoacid-CoA transferase [Lachnotalea glycerini]PXV91117.1 butyryl-CoA:acetoacetate CoA-transferase beta subunit [Lachnotalea glycerini]RDY31176.1 3-oxoacid CoA-transferase subunit B [Lachnotalea glycerini]